MAVPVDVWSKFLQSKDRMLVVDPFNGLADLDAGVLRHTSSAFAEDAVRVLRTARFAARYDTFTVDPSTIELMKAVVVEMNYVPQERIWVEFQKGLMENSPYNMIDTLLDTTAPRMNCCGPSPPIRRCTPAQLGFYRSQAIGQTRIIKPTVFRQRYLQ
jgi:hypothetical protein